MRAFCKENVKNPTPNPFLAWRTPQGACPALLWHVRGALSRNPAFPHRHHGLLRHVPHQAEEGGDGNTGTALGRIQRSRRRARPHRGGPSVPSTGPRMVFWAQVKVLELEKRLEGERVRLGELRKQHYVLAGGCEDAPEDGETRPAPAPRRGILKKPPIAQKPDLGQVGLG